MARATEDAGQPGEPAKVLLVDDDPRNLLALEAALAELGQDIVRAASGADALRRLLEQDFALILLDVRMPDMDGFETARLIRGRSRSRYTPIIFLTAYSELEDQVLKAYSLGAVDFLFKPVVPEILRSKVAVFVELERKTELVRKQSELLRTAQRRAHEQRLAEEKRRWEGQALQRRAEELAEADRRKDEFLAVLAHELRNPLAPLRTAAELLRLQDSGDAMTRQAREVMERQLQHLVRLIDDLLDVSRITSGKIELHKEPVEVAAIVEHAVQTARPLIEERGHELRMSLPGKPLYLHADFTRLTQVLANLLNNAAKYTERNGTIEIACARKAGEIVFLVTDNGCGIPRNLLAQVFESFVQAERGRGGLGLGLALVRRLVELHGGAVSARSEGSGKGSQFEVRIPYDERIRPPSAADEDRVCRGQGSLLVVVIDDNKDICSVTRQLLELWGHRVKVANDGPSGLDLVLKVDPDVALVDIGLPGMDGYTVARRVRAEGRPRRPRLIAMTGYGRREDREQALASGFDEHLAKPAKPDDLSRLLNGENHEIREIRTTLHEEP